MSRTGRLTAEFAGEERLFCLRIGELMELQESRDAGPAVVLARLSLGQWMIQDVVEVIRLGLIGGGMEPAPAARMIEFHVKQRAFDLGGENGLVMLAVRILAAATHGVEDEPVGKAGEARNGSTTFPTEGSGGAPSSAMPS